MKNIINRVSKTIRPPLLILLTVFITGNAMAQNGSQLSEKFKYIAKPGSTKEWITFWDSAKINPKTFFVDYKNALGLSADDEMTVKRIKKDTLGFMHYRYQQFYKKHPVLYGEYIVHQQNNGIVHSANGRLITGLNAGSTASVPEKQALDAALQYMHAAKYLWQNADMEKELRRQEKNQQATYFPKGELVYAPATKTQDFKPSDYKLAWQFKIYTDDPKILSKTIYVDAVTNQVIHTEDIAINCSGGTGTSAFNGTVSFSTQAGFFGGYYSHNDCQATDIYVYDCAGGGTTSNLYYDADNTWTASTQQSAVQAQWGASMTYNYYYGQHSRQSWDNAASDMIAYNNAYAGSNNACWGCTGNSAIFYAGSTSAATDDWNTNDIMGHEFTHGVTQSEAGLVYSYESGALNESFSDIFGEMVESWSEGNCDYLVGADRGAIRSFINPKDYSDSYAGIMPDTYKGTGWYYGSSDNGGVHHNSSVQNHWFYLLSEGGSGTNDVGTSFNVTAITRFKARLIVYRALTEYLTSSSQYIDSRKATLQAAYDLYGQCSQEIQSVGDAWHAVNVESQSPAYTINACGSYPASGSFIQAISTLYGGNGCTTTITPSTTTVYFTGRDKVILSPGFIAQSGSNFVAYLEPCSSTRWITTPQDIKSSAEQGLQTSIVKNTGTTQSSATAKTAVANETVSVSPNPFTSSFVLSVNAKKDGKAQVTIYNSYGAKVKEQTGINLVKGLNKLPFNCSSFTSGVYVIEVNFGDSKIVKKIVKA